MQYTFFGVLTALLITEYFVWKKWTKKSVYHFRTVAMAGLAFGTALFFICSLTAVLTGENTLDTPDAIMQLVKAFPVSFASILIGPIGALGLLMFLSNIALMRHEGMRPKNLVGTFLGVLFVAGTIVLFALSKALETKAETVASPILEKAFEILPLFFFLLFDYVECLMVGIIVMGYVASRQKPAYDKDYIIILGCSISRTGGLLPLIKGRTSRAVKYAWDQEIATGKPLKYIPSGGQGPDEIMSEGSAMELFLLSHGAEPYEVLPEKKSRSTYENFQFSKAIADQEHPGAKLAFATTNYHMLRSGMIAHKLGMELEGIASDTKWYFWPNGFAREVVAIFVMTKKKHILFAGLCFALAVLLTL